MDIRLLDTSEVIRLINKGWIPKEWKEDCEDLYVFGGFENGEIIAATVFEDDFRKRFATVFKWIFVHRDYRNTGIGSSIYAYSENSLREIGIKEIICNRIVEHEFAGISIGFIMSLGFSAMYLDRTIRRYKRGHFRGQNADLLYANISKLGLSIETIEDYSDRRLLAFMEKRNETDIYISSEDYEPAMCSFVILNDRIEAALCMKRFDSKSIITEGYYVSDKIKQQDKLLPFMMSYLVKSGEEKDDLFANVENVYVAFKKEYRASAVENTFGTALEGYYLQHYVKRLCM